MTSPIPRSRPRRSIGVGLLVLTLLAWFAVALVVSQRPAELPKSAASTFVPPDATHAAVTFTSKGRDTRSMVESSLIDGAQIFLAVNDQASRFIDPPAEGVDGASWWREAMIPGDLSVPTRYRIRSIGPAGIYLRLQDWEDLGLTFADLLELPAGVRAGQSWSSAGLALARPTDIQLTYRNASSAATPGDPGAVRRGCLTVTSTTTLAPQAGTSPAPTGRPSPAPDEIRETNLWCPGAGVVDSHGSFRGVDYEISDPPAQENPVTVEALAPAAVDVGSAAGWRVRPAPVVGGDRTFGQGPADLGAIDQTSPPTMTAGGVLVLPYLAQTDLNGLIAIDSGELWRHWWVRPGGTVTTMTTVGSLVLVTTTERKLLAYAGGGRLRWSVDLDDVAIAAPIPVGTDRVAVATVSGEVAVFAGADGRRVWRAQLDRGVHRPLASDGAVVVATDTAPNVTAFDAADGRQRWQVDADSAYTAGVAVGPAGVLEWDGATVLDHDPTTGRTRWIRQVGLGLASVSLRGDQVWVSADGDLQGWSAADGRTRWTLPGASDGLLGPQACPTGGTTPTGFAFRGRDLVAVDDTGGVVGSWTLPTTAGGQRTLSCALGRVWVTWLPPGQASPVITSVGPS